MVNPGLPHNNDRAELYWVDENTLGIRWSDGHSSQFGLEDLRQNCPCALCRAAQQQPLTIHRAPSGGGRKLKALEVNPVGRYAIQITWNDGHRTGIYTYESLRAWAPAEA